MYINMLLQQEVEMPLAVPIKDMRDTARFSELVEKAAGPVTVTKNGYSKFVVMRAADYDAMAEENALARLMTRMETAERERAEHAGRDAFDALADIRARHGL